VDSAQGSGILFHAGRDGGMKKLAQRIEAVNAQALIANVRAAQQLFPDSNADIINVADGVAAFVGADIPLSYAVNLGMHSAVSDDDIARVVDFYRERGAVPQVNVCELADSSLLAALRNHNFQLHSFVNILACDLKNYCGDFSIPPEIRVRHAEKHEADLWTRVVDGGFGNGGELTENHRRMCLMLFSHDGAYPYFAELDGVAAGGGLLMLHEGNAGLAAASVLPEFRRRGVHSALIRARLNDGMAAGCDIAGYFCEPGGNSQRNAERHGFRLAYAKAVMKQP
jgi:hypothetical protein